MRTIFWSLLVVLPTFAQIPGTIALTEGWRFSPSDSVGFASYSYDDSRWFPVSVNTSWEKQGFGKHDRFAWYRLRLKLPSSIRNSARFNEGIRLVLGKIDDYDQTFLNGALIGVNGQTVAFNGPADTASIRYSAGSWNTERVYVLSNDDPRIRWDDENVIAVRVYDQGGPGGMWSGGQHIRPSLLRDHLDFKPESRAFSLVRGRWQKDLMMANASPRLRMNGTLEVSIVDRLTGRTKRDKSRAFSLGPKDTVIIPTAVRASDSPTSVIYSVHMKDFDETVIVGEDVPYILTPQSSAKPRINTPRVYGARPGHPFLFTISASGARPMKFKAQGLPPGLSLDATTGLITGRATEAGTTSATLTAENAKGRDSRGVSFVIGKDLALTPPLGWNSWNCWGLSVDADKVLASAAAFKEKGLLDHGWSYINIDDGWEIKGDSPEQKRAPDGTILTNEKFPDMKGLADAVHAMGLKLGIYSSPGPLTCGGYTASYQYELYDARTWGQWGIDYLKYDWCSYGTFAKDTSRPEFMKPYLIMRDALDQVGRDIVYSLCQYGMGNVWEWGESVGGDLWRTTGDITDTWESMRDIGFHQVANAPFAGPSRWNDPDMLVVGWVGWGPNLHPTKLTPDEQYTHISLWSLLSAPLLIGCDLQRLDDFTLNLLTNDEVLEIDQDPLGIQAVPVLKIDSIEVWVKELWDGSRAVGVFNLGSQTVTTTVDLTKVGISGVKSLRDVWRQRAYPHRGNNIRVSIAPHGVVLLRTSPQS